MQPIRPHSRTIVGSDTRAAAGPAVVVGGGGPSPSGAVGITGGPGYRARARTSQLLGRCGRGCRADRGEQEPDARFQLGGHALEGRVGVLAGPARGGRIGNAPVQLLGTSGELRAYL